MTSASCSTSESVSVKVAANGMICNENTANTSQTAAPLMAHIPSEALVPMPVLPQAGNIVVGPGAKKEAQLLGLGLARLRSKQKDWLTDAKKYAKEQSIKQVLLRQTVAHQQNQQKVAMYAQALSLMARVYIGSISFEVREEMIKNSFGVFGPIKSINMSWDAVTGHHKGFAFLEYEVPEAALLAQESMNGVLMGGRNLKVGRPSNMPQAQPIIEMVMQEAKSYHRVYVSSVHPDLSESDLKSVFEAFGEVIKCQLARATGPNAGMGHRGFGYLEFNNAASAAEAISGMNMFDLGGQYLRVGKCITPPDALTYIVPTSSINLPTAAAVAAAEVTAKIQEEEMIAKKLPALSPPKYSANILPSASSAPNLSTLVVPSAAHTAIPPIGVAAIPPIGVAATLPPIGVVMTVAPVGLTTVPPVGVAAVPPVGVSAVPSGFVPSATGSTAYASSSPLHPVMTPTTLGLSSTSLASTSSRRGFGGFATQYPVVQPTNVPPPQVFDPPLPPVSSIPVPTPPVTLVSSIPPPPAPSSSTVASDLISRINVEIPKPCTNEPATFAPLPANIAPVDKKAATSSSPDRLAISGVSTADVSDSLALALSDSSIPGRRDLQKANPSKDKAKSDRPHHPKKKKKASASAPKGPQLNTPQALEAASRAGEINDQMQAQLTNSDDVSLASQEGLEIRGNDARHLLMHKLMRVNKSTVIVLKNMVTIDDCDEDLEGEIRDECSNYGSVEEVLIVQDPTNETVKVFVRFANFTEAESACKALDRRFFDGSQIIAQIYDQSMFDHNEYSG